MLYDAIMGPRKITQKSGSKDKKKAPVSGFSGRNITGEFFSFRNIEETPIITEKIISCFAKQLAHTEYLDRIDAAEKIGKLVESGVNVEKLVPALKIASEDYSPHVRRAAEKTLAKIKENKLRKYERDAHDTDPLVFTDGRTYTLPDALEDKKARPKAIEKLRLIAKLGVTDRFYDVKFAIIGQIKQITDNKDLMKELGEEVKRDIDRILYGLSHDKHSGIKTLARMVRNSL